MKNPVTCYFLDYWEDLWTGVSSNRDLLTSFNPRVVIRELLDEITLNKVNNKANEEFFKRTLSNYLKQDPASSRRLKIYLQMMLNEIDLSKHRPRYLPKLCISALTVFENFEYFEDCIESLLELIESTSTQSSTADKNKIRQIVNHLIVELREVGYGDGEIQKFPEIIFSEIRYKDKWPIWDFPHQFSCDDYKNEEELDKFKQQLEEVQSTLTEKDRIRALLTLARKTKKPTRYIFQVTGMTDVGVLEVADTKFYSPSQERLMSEDKILDPKNDMELLDNRNNSQSINATVIVETISPISGEMIARSKVEKAFALCRRIMKGENRLRLSRSYLALDINGKAITARHSSSLKINDNQPTKSFSLNSNNQPGLKNRLIIIEEARKVAEANNWGRRFNESCLWLKRAEESDSYVDKLLSFWICIETLCAKSEEDTANWLVKDNQKETDIYLIKEVIGKMHAVLKCYNHGWMIYNYLASNHQSPPFFRKLTDVNIPPELISKSQLDAQDGQEISIKNLIDCSDDIKKILPEGLLRDQLEELHSFYTDKKTALSVLQKHLQTTKDELAFIYRMRNKIAHNGSNEHPLLPSLCKIVEIYAKTFFNQIVHLVAVKKELELNSVLIMVVQDYDLIEMKLRTEEPKNIFLNDD